jgi:hypothetical protein
MGDNKLKKAVFAALDRIFKENIDICPRCGKEINLALPHSYDYELDAPVHRQCEASE